ERGSLSSECMPELHRCGDAGSAPPQALGDRLRLAHDAQHVRAGQACEVAIGPATANQLGEQVRVAGDVAQAIGLEDGPVEVSANADVLDAGDAGDVLDVIRDRREWGEWHVER